MKITGHLILNSHSKWPFLVKERQHTQYIFCTIFIPPSHLPSFIIFLFFIFYFFHFLPVGHFQWSNRLLHNTGSGCVFFHWVLCQRLMTCCPAPNFCAELVDLTILRGRLPVCGWPSLGRFAALSIVLGHGLLLCGGLLGCLFSTHIFSHPSPLGIWKIKHFWNPQNFNSQTKRFGIFTV